MQLIPFAGVHLPDAYTAFLVDSITCGTDDSFLDLCCGSGIVGIIMAKRGLAVTAVDISLQAAKATRVNASRNGVNVSVFRGDLFGPVRGLCFNAIAATPPIMPLPQPAEDLGDHYSIANCGGARGRDVYDRVLHSAREHLFPGGSLWLIHPWFFSMEVTSRIASAHGLRSDLVSTRSFPMGSLSGRMLPYIESIGFKPSLDEYGRPVQLMSVVRITSE